MRFKLIKDLVLNTGIEEEIILSKDSIIEPDEDGQYFFVKIGKSYSKDMLLSKPHIFKIIEYIEINVKDIDESDEDIIGNYRIQLEIKTIKNNPSHESDRLSAQ